MPHGKILAGFSEIKLDQEDDLESVSEDDLGPDLELLRKLPKNKLGRCQTLQERPVHAARMNYRSDGRQCG